MNTVYHTIQTMLLLLIIATGTIVVTLWPIFLLPNKSLFDQSILVALTYVGVGWFLIPKD